MASDDAPHELDHARLLALADQLGESTTQVAATLRDELAMAIDALDAGLAHGDLDAIDRATHAAQNSALMIASRPLLTLLSALDRSASDGDLAAARETRAELAGHWEQLSAQLNAVCSPAR